jgi:hypothetical protein
VFSHFYLYEVIEHRVFVFLSRNLSTGYLCLHEVIEHRASPSGS